MPRVYFIDGEMEGRVIDRDDAPPFLELPKIDWNFPAYQVEESAPVCVDFHRSTEVYHRFELADRRSFYVYHTVERESQVEYILERMSETGRLRDEIKQLKMELSAEKFLARILEKKMAKDEEENLSASVLIRGLLTEMKDA